MAKNKKSQKQKQKKGVQLVWKNLDYTVKSVTKRFCKSNIVESKTIIQNASGAVDPGETLSIIGPSGSGKTTLLNVLSGRIPERKGWTGSLTINGEVMSREVLKEVSGYVPQEDVLVGSQTVIEAMKFYADLSLPTNVSHKEKKERIDGILRELGLMKVRSSLIGYVGDDAAKSGLTRGLSGGERKRLSIGLQLIKEPSLLFLDEPTTGLDSFAAESIVRTLGYLASKGKTILYTIHQPSSELLNLFDKLMIIGHGKTLYFGPYSKTLEYFDGIGLPCREDMNPGDHFVEVIHIDREHMHEKKKYFDDVENAGFGDSFENAVLMEEEYASSKYAKYRKKKGKKPVLESPDGKKPGTLTQIGKLISANFKNKKREPNAFRAGLLQSIIVSVIMGAIYFDFELNDTSIQDRSGCLFFAVVFSMFSSLITPLTLFPTERKIFLFQTVDGLYSTLSYFIAKFVTEIPGIAINTIVFGSIIYFMTGLQLTVENYILFLLVLFAVSCTSFSFGSAIVGLFPDPSVAMTVFPLIFVPMMIFSGFYSNSDRTPVYFVWVEYISFLKYSYRAVMSNEFSGLEFECTEEELAIYNGICRYTTGEDYLDFRNLNDIPIYVDLAVLLGLFLVFQIIGFLFLKMRASKKKN
eukprot:TRINITY_DN391_c0_g1_i2.p1 TRINITY_DN391_c0_g1~~TRINITY_DN391_c0_g1_i2.p1  ORF type:complete len:638 (-),score=147.94 TRINITY_DN391_c0_g1_i2:37-1950(-)